MAPRVVMPALSRSERSCMSPSVAPGRRCAGRAGQSTKSGSMRFDLETSHFANDDLLTVKLRIKTQQSPPAFRATGERPDCIER